MQKVTDNVFTSTGIRGCNPSYVVTSAGVVVVDTPQLPTKAVQMRHEAESRGPIRHVINTEHHVDHIFGNYYFKGAGSVVQHQGVYENFMVPTPDLDPFDERTIRLANPAFGTFLSAKEVLAMAKAAQQTRPAHRRGAIAGARGFRGGGDQANLHAAAPGKST